MLKMDSWRRSENIRVGALMGVIFLASRIVYAAGGVRFDASTLAGFWQYLDVPILKHKLLEGCFYLHSQPPGFNLFLGLVLKIFPSAYAGAFHACYLIFGFALYWALYKLLRYEGFGLRWAVGLATAYVVTPVAILYENWLFYTYPTAVLLALAALALWSYARHRTLRYAFAFTMTIAVVCLIRSAFHLGFLVICIVLICLPRGINRKRVLLVSLPALALVLGLYVKNAAVFGNFGPSTWAGMNIWRIARRATDVGEEQRLADEGKIPAVAAMPSFLPLDRYPPEYGAVPARHAAIESLFREVKDNGLSANYNHYGYIALSREYMTASKYVVRRNFRSYLGVVTCAWLLYMRPAAQHELLQENREAMLFPVTLMEFLFDAGEVDLSGPYRAMFGVERLISYPILSLIVMPVVMLLALGLAILRARDMLRTGNIESLPVIFMVLTVFYVAVLGNAVEFRENNRFRMMTDPMLYVVLAVAIRALWTRKNPSTGSGTGSVRSGVRC